jgi:hypothetical protein
VGEQTEEDGEVDNSCEATRGDDDDDDDSDDDNDDNDDGDDDDDDDDDNDDNDDGNNDDDDDDDDDNDDGDDDGGDKGESQNELFDDVCGKDRERVNLGHDKIFDELEFIFNEEGLISFDLAK